MRKTQFPRLVIPLSVVLTSLFNLGLNLVVVFVFILAYGVEPVWTWLLLPVIVGPLIVITTAVSMIVSSLYPRFRDMAIIWSVLATVLFYATPVLYPIEKVPGALRDLFLAQPARAAARARAQVDRRPDGARPGGGGRRLAGAAAGGRDLRRHVRGGRLAVPARGAADRRGALTRVAARAAVAVVAVLVLAWLGGDGARRPAGGSGGGGAAVEGASPAVLARAETDLRRANLLNPATGPDLNRALVCARAGATTRSVALLEDVLRREPDNLTAWRVLMLTLTGRRPGRALAAQRRLDPAQRAGVADGPLGERDQGAGEHDRGQRDGRQLPVPVDRGVEEPDRQRRGRPGGRGGAARARPAARQAPRRRHMSAKATSPTQAQLGGDLDLERVRVPHGLGDRALAQPFDAEPGRAEAGERLAPERPSADAPVLVAVRAEAVVRRPAWAPAASSAAVGRSPSPRRRGPRRPRRPPRRRARRSRRGCGSGRSAPPERAATSRRRRRAAPARRARSRRRAAVGALERRDPRQGGGRWRPPPRPRRAPAPRRAAGRTSAPARRAATSPSTAPAIAPRE